MFTFKENENYEEEEEISFEINMDNIHLITKRQIQSDLGSPQNKLNYSFKENIKGKSPYLKNFKTILYHNKVMPFVMCKGCNIILSYNGKNGTGSLVRHKCSRIVKVDSNTFEEDTNNSKYSKMLYLFVRKQIEMVSQDLLPPDIIEGEGFKKFCQELLNLGQSFTSKSPIDNIPTPSRDIFNQEVQKIKNQLITCLHGRNLAFGLDKWTNNNNNYITLSTYFIDDTFTYKKYVLGTTKIINNNNVYDSIISILNGYFKSCEKIFLKSILITNNKDNLNEDSITIYNCTCTLLNSILNSVLETIEHENLRFTIQATRDLFKYFIETNLKKNLTKNLTSWSVKTWHAVYFMFEFLLDMSDEIQNILHDINENYRLNNIDMDIVKSFIEFFKIFKDCSKDLSSDTKPSVTKFVLCEQKLKNHCNLQNNDNDFIKKLKIITLIKLNLIFQANDNYYVALFLDSNFKNMQFLPQNKREYVINLVKKLIKETPDNVIVEMKKENDFVMNLDDDTTNLYVEFQDNTSPSVRSREDFEVETYLRSMERGQEDILDYWKNHIEFPLLRKLARRILNIPLSTMTEEKIFHHASRFLCEKRSRLDGVYLDEMLFLHQNFKDFL